MSDFWPDFFLLAGPAGSSGRARMAVDISVWGGPVPGILGSATANVHGPGKVRICCHRSLCPSLPLSVAHRCGLADAADVLTV